MENILEITDVQKSYKGFSLKKISFRLPYGYIMGLIGPNGAGKTTLIKLIMNLVKREGGQIRIFGMDNLKYERQIKARIGFVYDLTCFHEDATLQDNKTAYALFYEKWDNQKFRSLAAEFKLPLHKNFKTLSHGMKTKFSLALALSHDADLLIMDEPTAGLDPVFRRELLAELAGLLVQEHKSVLFSTHITSDLEQIADYITFIRNGEIIFSGNKEQILESWGIIKGGEELLKLKEHKLICGYEQSATGVQAITSDIRQARSLCGSNVLIEKASLDDIICFFDKQGGTYAV